MAANPFKVLADLQVSGSATFKNGASMNSQKITNVLAATEANDAVVYSQHSTEVSRAQSAETSLSTGLSAEVSRAGSAEASVSTAASTAVSAEASRAGSAETSLSTSISAEASRAGSVEVSLSTGLSAEASRAASAEASVSTAASTAVSAEASRAGSAEASLSTGLSAEISRAGSAEASVSTAASTAVSAEASRAGSAEASLSTGLSAEVSRAGSAEASVSTAASTAISAEASRAGSAEASLSTGLSAEVSRAGSAETSLSTGLSAEVSRAGSAETSLSTGISAEASRAGSVEVSLSTGLSAEASRAGSVEVSLSNGLSTEVSRAGSAEASLSTGLSAEVSRAGSVEASLSTSFLRLDGTTTMTGELKMGNQDIVNAKSGTFNGDLLVKGNLNVSGALTYINTDNLDIKDAKITVAKSAPDLATAADAGIYIGSDTAPLAKVSVNSSGEWYASGSAGLAIALTGSNDDGTFAGDTAGSFNVEKTIRNIGSTFQMAFQGISNSYANARYITTQNLDGNGEATIALPSTNNFVNASGSNVAIDVMLQDGTSWTNDLVSVYLKQGATYLEVQISAPAKPNGVIRLVAVNESSQVKAF